MRAALLKAIQTIIDAQKEILSDEDFKNSANGLNLCASDGEQLVATRFRNHPTEQPASLYYSTEAGVVLDRRYPGDSNKAEIPTHFALPSGQKHEAHLIVASEPTSERFYKGAPSRPY
jgi:glutamine amidotransferase